MSDVPTTAKKIIANVEKVIVGKRRQIVLSLVSWFCGGHVLLEDVPGVAKTMLARALAQSVGCSFKRIQCTPDLLPTDVTGVSVFNQKTTEFEFRPGPIFAQVVLADEINRTTPRTQAALLEAMAEGRVTVDGVTHELKPPFWVIATQNPIDHEGTFPLPEAQLDRFLVRFNLGYPSMDEELRRCSNCWSTAIRWTSWSRSPAPRNCWPRSKRCATSTSIRRCGATSRRSSRARASATTWRLGGSPRASLALFRTAQALAAVSGRNFVRPDDVKQMSGPVLTHRLILRPESRLRKLTAAAVVADLVADQRVPMLSNETEAGGIRD